MIPTQRNTTSPGGGLCQGCSPSSATSQAVQLELGEGWLSGERHTGPKPGPRAVLLRITAGQKDRLRALVVNICLRDRTICPRPGGESSLRSQTSCRAPDVDLSSRAEAENTAKTQTEPLSAGTFISLIHVLSVGCDHSEV